MAQAPLDGATNMASRLRSRTRPDHEAAEALVGLPEGELSLGAVAGVIGAFHHGLSVLEALVAPRLSAPDVPAHLRAATLGRSGALRADLEELARRGAPVTTAIDAPAPAPALAPGEAVGAWYVLEGSRLGGRVVARRLLAAAPAAAGALSGLEGDGPAATAARWRAFTTWLAARPPAEEDAAVAGARRAFAVVVAPFAARPPVAACEAA